MTNAYDIGDLVTLTGRFYSDPALTVLANPTTATLSLRAPNGTVTTPTPTPISTGMWTYAWTPSMAGLWRIKWAGTGAIVSASVEEILIHDDFAPGLVYLSLDQLKATLEMTGTTFADADVAISIGAASRAVDTITGRRFWLDADATSVRYYTPESSGVIRIDDLVTMTSVTIDRSGIGAYSEAWVSGTDYVLEPYNAPSARPARPYTTIRLRYNAPGRALPTYIEQSVKVTGQFGWPAVPDDVTAATGIIAAKLLRRTREAPFGIVTAGLDSGVAMRIARTDPDVYTLLQGYERLIA